jgi:vancomycin permeability regulator SanA
VETDAPIGALIDVEILSAGPNSLGGGETIRDAA